MQASTLYLDFRYQLGCSSNLCPYTVDEGKPKPLESLKKKKFGSLISVSPFLGFLARAGFLLGQHDQAQSDLSSVVQCLMTEARFKR